MFNLYDSVNSAEASEVDALMQELGNYLEQTEVEAKLSYKIPELGEGGACSLFGHLQDEPFELASELGLTEENRSRLNKLAGIVAFVVEKTRVDWFGIYQCRDTSQGPQLLKLAYEGAPSRPLFPLTEAFAAASNNVHVALSGKGRVINNVTEYVANGGEYYTCDPKVKAETCLPLFDGQGKVVGIIDAEAFASDIFEQKVLAVLVAACLVIPRFLPQ